MSLSCIIQIIGKVIFIVHAHFSHSASFVCCCVDHLGRYFFVSYSEQKSQIGEISHPCRFPYRIYNFKTIFAFTWRVSIIIITTVFLYFFVDILIFTLWVGQNLSIGLEAVQLELRGRQSCLNRTLSFSLSTNQSFHVQFFYEALLAQFYLIWMVVLARAKTTDRASAKQVSLLGEQFGARFHLIQGLIHDGNLDGRNWSTPTTAFAPLASFAPITSITRWSASAERFSLLLFVVSDLGIIQLTQLKMLMGLGQQFFVGCNWRENSLVKAFNKVILEPEFCHNFEQNSSQEWYCED